MLGSWCMQVVEVGLIPSKLCYQSSTLTALLAQRDIYSRYLNLHVHINLSNKAQISELYFQRTA